MSKLRNLVSGSCSWSEEEEEDGEASLPPLQFSSYRPTAAEDTAPAAITLLLRGWELNILKNWPETWLQYYCISATNRQRLLCPMPTERETPLCTVQVDCATVNKPSSMSLAARLPISRPVGDDIDCILAHARFCNLQSCLNMKVCEKIMYLGKWR